MKRPLRLLRRISRNLRSSILFTFSALLFFSFLLIGVALNFAASQYIRTSARGALYDAMDAHWVGADFDTTSDEFFDHVRARGIQVNFFHRSLRYFYVDEHSQLAGTVAVAYSVASDITGALEAKDANLGHLEPFRLRVGPTVYYVAALRNMIRPPNHYTIYYIDITDLQRITSNVNLRLFVVVAIIWFTTMLMSTFLAGSLAKPIRSLSDCARQIGQGDFTPTNLTFANEEFEELNQSLNHTAKQLAKYDNDQKAFFQNVSHELRTPLMSIKSYAEGIKYGVMDPEKASDTILECTDRLTEMVGDILYVSRIDNITPPMMDDVNLTALIEERVARQKSLVEQKGLALEFNSDGEPLQISCVTSYIERAIDNLISNAIRHAKSTITIEVAETDTKAIIRVLDDGPGFEPDQLPHVFERFYKGKNGLTGIGLSIVKSIIEQHKGTATAENGESGAILTISLPLVN